MRADLPIVLVLDDVTIALDAQRDRSAGEISPISEAMLMGRSKRIGIVYAVHANCLTSTAVRLNTENIIVTSAQGEDISFLSRAMGLDVAQAQRLRTLQPGEVVVYAPATWPAAVYGRFPYMTAIADVGEIAAEAAAFLSQVTTVDGDQEKPEVKDSIDPEALRLMIEAAFHSFLGVTSLYQRVGLDRVAGRRAQEFLHARALITPRIVGTGQRGGQLTLLEVSDLGWSALAERGMLRPPRVTRGEFLHNAAALALEELGKREGALVFYERAFDNVFADVVWQTRDGRLTVFQIGLSKERWEVESARRLLKFPGISELVLVVKDKAFLDKVSALLRKQVAAEDLRRVQLRCVGDVLKQVQ